MSTRYLSAASAAAIYLILTISDNQQPTIELLDRQNMKCTTANQRLMDNYSLLIIAYLCSVRYVGCIRATHSICIVLVIAPFESSSVMMAWRDSTTITNTSRIGCSHFRELANAAIRIFTLHVYCLDNMDP